MSQKYSKSQTIKGTFKGLAIHNGSFMDEETGEAVDVIEKLTTLFDGEGAVFDLAATLKTDEELEI